MRKINYKSDFDFILRLKDCNRKDVSWPSFDWDARFWTSTRANAVSASCKGGQLSNCFNDNGLIHIVLDNHHLSKGKLEMEFHAELPNGIYPDGVEDVFAPQPLDIMLVDGQGDCFTEAEVEYILPFAVVTAYDTARAAGFDGTAEEYYAGLSALPALSASVSDLAAAKAEVAAALRLHGVEAADSDSLRSMAAKVAALRLAVPSQPGVVAHDWNGVPCPDLLNILRNNRRPDEYPYLWAVRTADATVRLAGADAYLCSDGHFTTEPGTHTFGDYAAGERWIIYYHRDRSYTVAPTAGYVTEICVLNGTPGYEVIDTPAEGTVDGCVAVGPLRSYTTDLPPEGEDTPVHISSAGLTDVYLRGIRRISGDSACGSGVAVTLTLPDLEEFAGANTFNASRKLRHLGLPALRRYAATGWVLYPYTSAPMHTLEFPALEELHSASTAGLVYRAYQQCTLSLPSLRTISGGVVTRECGAQASPWTILAPAFTEMRGGNFCIQSAIDRIDLPALTTMSGGTLASGCTDVSIDLPALTEMAPRSLLVSGNKGALEIKLGALTDMRGYNIVSKGMRPGTADVSTLRHWHSSGEFEPIVKFTEEDTVREVAFPRLESYGSSYSYIVEFTELCEGEYHVYVPALTEPSGAALYTRSDAVQAHLHVGLGAPGRDFPVRGQFSYTSARAINTHLHVAPGFRCGLPYADGFAGTTHDELVELIGNLADNTANATLTLNLGSTLLSRLSDDEIALATAKNYTLR